MGVPLVVVVLKSVTDEPRRTSDRSAVLRILLVLGGFARESLAAAFEACQPIANPEKVAVPPLSPPHGRRAEAL
jgi:hypothetical protein